MEMVKGYVMCALVASAIAGILKSLSSSMRGFEKYVGLVCSLVVIILLSFPIVTVISEINEAISESTSVGENNDPSDNIQNGEEIMAEYYVKSVESTLCDIISERFSIDKKDFEVLVTLNNTNAVEKIIITLYSEVDTNAIKDFTQNALCIKTEIRSAQNNEN